MLIAEGRNIVQVSRWLGHHSPSFTLDDYAHLMGDGVGAPLEPVTCLYVDSPPIAAPGLVRALEG